MNISIGKELLFTLDGNLFKVAIIQFIQNTKRMYYTENIKNVLLLGCGGTQL